VVRPAGAALGSLALLTEPEARRARLGLRNVVLGVASAAGLYGLFQVGDRAARIIGGEGGEEGEADEAEG